MLKCEYVDEFEPELVRQGDHWRDLESKLGKVYARARARGYVANRAHAEYGGARHLRVRVRADAIVAARRSAAR